MKLRLTQNWFQRRVKTFWKNDSLRINSFGCALMCIVCESESCPFVTTDCKIQTMLGTVVPMENQPQMNINQILLKMGPCQDLQAYFPWNNWEMNLLETEILVTQ